ncbi:uncharacterized protein LOC134968855 isoform X2 [Pseudophryne corroboree]|uniref:uncharacterized protein LOC134968855 isoform X2 n=1 Tax=Pseudophryne corroboree TaxID=495146 RepID=UPI003081735C
MKSAGKKVKVQKTIKKDLKNTEDTESQTEQTELASPAEAVNEDPAVFEGLCERMLSALCLLQTSVSEVLDVKDEMILQNVPSSVQAQLSLSTSRLFRSLTDLYVPSTELVRMVRVFGPQWEQKRLILEQLQGEHERLQRLLSLSLRRVQHLEAQRVNPNEPSHETHKDWDTTSSFGFADT